jgi:thioredoxin reductase/Fe-S-cluster-containing hydrogenase component 2/CRP-like cAMP-binding protein
MSQHNHNQAEHYHIAIVGSGPAGLSAAARAAQRDKARFAAAELSAPSHVLLEGFHLPAKTIQYYQKGKLVMAEPGFLNLRSDCQFSADARENVLDQWQEDIERLGINVRYNAAVVTIAGQKGQFRLTLASGEIISAEFVVLAIGLEGNPRKLDVPGEDNPDWLDRVQYTLNDPEEFSGEHIVVVGAGDSAIENALALSRKNRVTILNRRAEFSRAKEGNLNAILSAINDRRVTLECLYETKPVALEPSAEKTGDGLAAAAMGLVVETPTGRKTLPCDRIIARLGAIPPRQFIENLGITFGSAAADAAPTLSAQCESSVPGLYVVGSLAGYPLIKQAMNQGYDVVEYIHGHNIQPADHELLELQFGLLPYRRTPDELLRLFQQRIPMFRELNSLVFRQLIIESSIWVALSGAALANAKAQGMELAARAGLRQPAPNIGRALAIGEAIFHRGDYTNTFFMILDGEVVLEREDGSAQVRLERGQFFGEDSLVSGRPREYKATAGSDCILVETPRRTMIKLMNSNDQVRRGIDWMFTVRALQKHFAPRLSSGELRTIAQAAELKTYQAGEILFHQGEIGDCLHIIRRGSVTLQRLLDRDAHPQQSEAQNPDSADQYAVVAQLQAGQLVGEMALMGLPLRRETALASVLTETIVLQREGFLRLLELDPSSIDALQANASAHAKTYTAMQAQTHKGPMIGFLMAQGLGEATNALLIDESLCIGCNQCETACAETHGGISRLNRAKGETFAQIQVPISCRHCEHPHCMKDCPPDAIHRAETGEVFIADTCIGCGNCITNCPYDAIKLAYPPPPKPSLLRWLLFGAGPGPGEPQIYEPSAGARESGKKAVKCDACMNLATGPACVSACPTGAAARMAPDAFIQLAGR